MLRSVAWEIYTLYILNINFVLLFMMMTFGGLWHLESLFQAQCEQCLRLIWGQCVQ